MIQLEVQILVHPLKGSADGIVVLELDGDRDVDEGFEEAEEERPHELGATRMSGFVATGKMQEVL